MFERVSTDPACVLVHVTVGANTQAEDSEREEFIELARSAGLVPQARLDFRRRSPHPRFYFGRGQAEQLRRNCARHSVRLVVVNTDLSPSQERNLEAELECRVLGRTGLILDIFAQRARSHEGKLQVELAQLNYLSTRLVRGWDHLERQKGGIGLRGPGETQLELDRRLLTRRIQALRRRLKLVERQRNQSRARRRQARLFHVALVGYTNVGKSTLFNCLTGSDVPAANQLFATLDPTHRRLRLGKGRDAVLSDTVGFVRDLPVELVRAFHSTLEELRACDLLLHVIDCSDARSAEHAAQVREVLIRIGAEKVPVLEVYNKADRLAPEAQTPKMPGRVWLSANQGTGVEDLRMRLLQEIQAGESEIHLRLPVRAYPLRAELHRVGQVKEERFTEQGECEMRLWLPSSCLARFERFRIPVPAASRESMPGFAGQHGSTQQRGARLASFARIARAS